MINDNFIDHDINFVLSCNTFFAAKNTKIKIICMHSCHVIQDICVTTAQRSHQLKHNSLNE